MRACVHVCVCVCVPACVPARARMCAFLFVCLLVYECVNWCSIILFIPKKKVNKSTLVRS